MDRGWRWHTGAAASRVLDQPNTIGSRERRVRRQKACERLIFDLGIVGPNAQQREV